MSAHAAISGPGLIKWKGQATEPPITFTVPARLRRTGKEARLLIDGAGGGARRTQDHSLCRLVSGS